MTAAVARADRIFEVAGAMPPPAVWALPAPIAEHEMQAARLAPRCIVQDYLFADVAALVAPGSAGKTTMSLHEFVCIVLRRPLWGLEVLEPGPVLVVTAEDRREYLVARLRRICEAMGLTKSETARVRDGVRIFDCTANVRRLTIVADDVVTVASFADELVQACKAGGLRPALVQFDPMVSFGVGESRVNDAEQGLIHAARVIANGLDCAVRYVHHTGVAKALDKAAHQYAGRGGSALADGCRMVHVLSSLTGDELFKATGERLTADQSAFALARPKISYAPPQTLPLYVRRSGFRFELLHALAAQSSDERAQAVGLQLGRFIIAEQHAGRRHTRHTLEQLKPDSLGRNEVRTALAWLSANGRLHDEPVLGEGGKRPAAGARTYLVASGEPRPRYAP